MRKFFDKRKFLEGLKANGGLGRWGVYPPNPLD
jgi:hypothetical protein